MKPTKLIQKVAMLLVGALLGITAIASAHHADKWTQPTQAVEPFICYAFALVLFIVAMITMISSIIAIYDHVMDD